MTRRRSFMAAAAAAAVAPTTFAVAAALRNEPQLAKASSEHFLPGGLGGIQRAQFGFTSTSQNGGYGTINLPQAGVVYMIPLTKLTFDEAGGAKYQLDGGGLVTVLQDGLYDLTANLDWPAQSRGSGQDGYDTNLRKLMIKRVPVAVAPPVYTPGEVTAIRADGKFFDNLAAHDTPGASVALSVRAVFKWEPGNIAVGGMAYRDFSLPTGSYAPGIGDHVRATHAALSDALLGSANLGLTISARMVAPLMVRVMIENRYGSGPVSIPKGELNVLAESSTSTAGNSTDAWAYLGSGAVRLLAGEKVMIAVRSQSPGDFLQIDNASFLRMANVVP